ncbi:MAG: hypothetical protein HYY84_18000 [Deltaproteobacteria bacterium]|nr:hypothetical protein [Deltaproteobacteria bacterium]
MNSEIDARVGGDDEFIKAEVDAGEIAAEENGAAIEARRDAERASGGDVVSQFRAMTKAEKIQAALKGGREMRGVVARDVDRSLHAFLLRNPGLTLEEVSAMARMASFSPDALLAISRDERWGRNASVALSLIRNPKVPLPVATQLLDKIGRDDLARIAKGQGVREPVAIAARRKLFGSR